MRENIHVRLCGYPHLHTHCIGELEDKTSHNIREKREIYRNCLPLETGVRLCGYPHLHTHCIGELVKTQSLLDTHRTVRVSDKKLVVTSDGLNQ